MRETQMVFIGSLSFRVSQEAETASVNDRPHISTTARPELESPEFCRPQRGGFIAD
jgi:hypothetical protein